MNINWYPGHIAKARKEIKSNLKDVDLVIEIIDARCMLSSINFFYNDISDKLHLIIVNKIDLADPKKLKLDFSGAEILYLDSRKNDIKKEVDKKIDKLCKKIYERYEKRGIKNYAVRAIVVGMPNVGKSTFINSYVKKKVNKVENKPGVTKKLSWSKISDKIYLLDTPGVTVPRFENNDVGVNLALVGSLNDDIFEKQDLAYEFIKKIKDKYFNLLVKRYKLTDTEPESDTIKIMDEIATKNGCIKKGKSIDYEKVSNMLLNDFRKGLIGRISLED